MGKYFEDSLQNFIRDFASGGAIRHFTDLGFTIDEIAKKLDYPVPKETIAEIVWQHYLDSGKICLEEPKSEIEKVRFIKEQNAYGRISMRKVTDTLQIQAEDYMLVDYGKQLYKNKTIAGLDVYPERIRKHIQSLPWPLSDVWIKKDLFPQT